MAPFPPPGYAYAWEPNAALATAVEDSTDLAYRLDIFNLHGMPHA